MRHGRIRKAGTLAAVAILAACGSDAVAPDPAVLDGTVTLEVTGGFGGADYAVALTPDGMLLGVRCVRLCDFEPDDTLLVLTPGQREAVAAQVSASGIAEPGPDLEYPTRCCDFFSFRLTFVSDARKRMATGSEDDALPTPLADLIRTLTKLKDGVPPLLVTSADGLSGYGADALAILGASLDGGTLLVEVSYGGGCSRHDLDAVAFGGWLESNPVRIRVAVTHDAHHDDCLALLHRTLRFDLRPLVRAYEEAYGSGSGSVVLLVQPGNLSGAVAPREVPFTF